MFFLGCDGGSTKTEFLLASRQDGLLARKLFPACNYLEVGRDAFAASMRSWIRQTLDEAGLSAGDLSFSVFGLTALGEVEGLEEEAARALGEYAPAGRCLLCNDSVLGWAGSLAGLPGINIVSGTGSIAYGEDEHGNTKRVGGWSLLFDDPGSSAWVARQTLSLFFRQADGRAPRGPLYSLLCEHWGLGEHPQYFGGKVLPELNRNRSALASVQLQARRAADAGDPGVQAIYRLAVEELLQMAQTVRDALCFDREQPVRVSYSGGFFKNGALVLDPLRAALAQAGMRLEAPRYSPAVGSLALASKRFLTPQELSAFLQKVQEVMERIP